nr:MAG TPA: hypothetical protein [Caudoviricetes sp.]
MVNRLKPLRAIFINHLNLYTFKEIQDMVIYVLYACRIYTLRQTKSISLKEWL